MPSVSIVRDDDLPWFYKFYNPFGWVLIEVMTPALDKVFEMQTKLKIHDDLLQIVLNERLGRNAGLKAYAVSHQNSLLNTILDAWGQLATAGFVACVLPFTSLFQAASQFVPSVLANTSSWVTGLIVGIISSSVKVIEYVTGENKFEAYDGLPKSPPFSPRKSGTAFDTAPPSGKTQTVQPSEDSSLGRQ